jgi:co-chaperonin GroES (HSP10)
MAKRKDVLAAGARSATFMGGSGENDIFRNVAPEGSFDTNVPVVEPVKVVRKKFIPTTGVLLVRRDEARSASGILVTETMEKEQPAEGIVLEVGPKVDIVVGSHVVFGKYAGAEFKLNGETLLLMEATEIKGTIVDEPEQTRVYPGVCIPGISRA